MGQTDSTPATVQEVIKLQEKLHEFQDVVSEEICLGFTEKATSIKNDLILCLEQLDQSIKGLKEVIIQYREATESESKILRSFTAIRHVVDQTLDSINDMKTGDLLCSLTSVLKLSVVMSGAFGGAPSGLVAAFSNIALVFLNVFTEKLSSSYGFIVHEESIVQRTTEDDSRLAGLRNKVKLFIETEVPRFNDPDFTFPLDLDILAELTQVASLVKSRFSRAVSSREWDRTDATKAVSTYCFFKALHVHLLTVLLVKFRAVEREADAVCIVDRLESLKNKVSDDLGFWGRFWHDFQKDQTREKFFEVLPEFNSTSSVVVEARSIGTSVLCKASKGVMVVHDLPEDPEACIVYNSEYDFQPVQLRVPDLHMLACLYKLSICTEGEDPTVLRLFCQALLDISAIPCAAIPLEDKNAFRTILKQAGIPPKRTWWWCVIT